MSFHFSTSRRMKGREKMPVLPIPSGRLFTTTTQTKLRQDSPFLSLLISPTTFFLDFEKSLPGEEVLPDVRVHSHPS